jgi:lipid II:glycine glycyltransferase (peptidoglycan interpeptide bridge formation enzyme)
MTPYGGFVLSSSPTTSVRKQETFFKQIIESLLKEIKKKYFFSISIANSPGFHDIRPFTSDGWESEVCYSYYINLENDLESHIDPSVRKNIRKAEKNRIIIEHFSDISRYYTLLCEMYTRKNLSPPPSKRLFIELYSFIRNQNCGEMVVAKTPDDEITCAEINIWDNRQAYSWTAASDARFLSSGATSLLRFNMIKRMQERGILKMDMMMGIIPQLSKFATRLNPALVPYYEIHKRIF